MIVPALPSLKIKRVEATLRPRRKSVENSRIVGKVAVLSYNEVVPARSVETSAIIKVED